MGVRLRNVGPALPTTCQWLRSHETFVSWLNDDQNSESHGFLWIKGKPGSGKSTIMRETLLWATREYSEQTFISYFFNARSPYRLAKSTLGMYQSLLHQLLSVKAKTPETYEQIRNLQELSLEEFSSKIDGSQTDNWSETEIQNFMVSLADTGKLPALTIFIDALDEDDGDDVQQMVAFFEGLQQRALSSNGILRICLSSRHYPHVTIGGGHIVLEEQLGHSEDINKYIGTRLLGKDSCGRSELQEKISKKAAGVFPWVVLMIQILNQDFNRGRGLVSMHQKLNHAPDKAQDLFRTILAKEAENKEECLTLLKWVLFAETSLRPIVVYAAVRHRSHGVVEPTFSSDDDEEVARYLLYCSRGLVEVTKATPPTVQFIHETVRELLVSTTILTNHMSTLPAATPATLLEQAEICHGMIAESCLSYLLEVNAQQAPVKPLRRPLTGYAAKHWWRHLEKISGSYRVRPLELASKFLTDHANQPHWKGLLSACSKDPVYGFRKISRRPPYLSCRAYHLLCRAVLANTPELVKEYVDAGADINSGRETVTALGCAVATGNTNMIEILLELNADPNAGQGPSILGLAVRIGHSTQVQMLLKAGALVNIVEDKWTPLMSAAAFGYEEVVHALLDWGADIDPEDEKIYGSPLVCAARFSDESMVKILIERGANAALGRLGTPLSMAASTGSRGKVELLLDHGASVDYGGELCHTPLEIAKLLNHREVADLLLAHGAREQPSDCILSMRLPALISWRRHVIATTRLHYLTCPEFRRYNPPSD